MRWRAGLSLLLFSCASLAQTGQAELAQRQEQARQQQAELRRQIDALQKNIESSTGSQQDAAQELRRSEKAISEVERELEQLQQRHRAVQTNMQELSSQIKDQEAAKLKHQQALAQQLGAQYRAGTSPWAALLSGDDPNVINRDLYYLSYVSRQQTEQVVALKRAVERLARLRAQAQKNEAELVSLSQASNQQLAELEKQKKEREQVWARVSAELKQQQQESGRLRQNDQRLGSLINGLEAEIAKQAELARIAEEKRRKEAAERAEQERQAKLAQQREAQKRAAELARLREQREQALLEHARATQPPLPKAPPRSGQEPEGAKPGAPSVASPGSGLPSSYQPPARDEQLAQMPMRGSGSLTLEETNLPAPAHAQIAHAREAEPAIPEPKAASPRLEPSGGFTGLKRGLLRPVRGPAQGRFGSERPDGGGAWRGVVLRAPAGEAVRAVGDGRVVFANWLSGFGNLLIIDHGREFLTVYAYNQSLLKQVGDVVARGDVVAKVGATGGQLEPGLYFEIRQKGNPVNPESWLAP